MFMREWCVCKMGQDTFCHRAFHVYSKLLTVGDPLSPFCIRSRKAVVQPQSLWDGTLCRDANFVPEPCLGFAHGQKAAAKCRLSRKACLEKAVQPRCFSATRRWYETCLFLLYHVVLFLVVSRDIDRRLVSAECFVGVPARCARRSFFIDLTVSNTLTLAAAFELWLSWVRCRWRSPALLPSSRGAKPPRWDHVKPASAPWNELKWRKRFAACCLSWVLTFMGDW